MFRKLRIFPWYICLLWMISYSYSASITTLSLSSSVSHQFEFISNSSYRYLFLRQYFIDLLNISHSSLIQSLIQTQHFIPQLEQIQYRRRRQSSSSNLISTIHSTNCSRMNHDQIQMIFQWSYPIESYSSIELIYHLNTKISSIPIEISIQQSSSTSNALFSIMTHLQYDSNRDLYSIDLSNYIRPLNDRTFLRLQIILVNQTCSTTDGYVIISSNKYSSNEPQFTSNCRLKTLQIQFEELGLANLIIRPTKYAFTYCDGSCLNILPDPQLSLRTFLQTILRKQLPSFHCIPSEYVDDQFLLRQLDGNLEIYPIKNAIVKRCACL